MRSKSKRVLILFLITFIIFRLSACSYPTLSEIDKFFDKYKLEADIQKKISLVKNFLHQLRNPDSVAEDKNLEYALKKLSQTYIETEDESILISVDGTRIDGGFANEVCGFYKRVELQKGFIERYRINLEAKEGIKRCEGISYSRAEIKRIIGEEDF